MLDNLKSFFKAQGANIIVTIIGGFVPMIINNIFTIHENSKNRTHECPLCELIKPNKCQPNGDWWVISEEKNFFFQSVFIFITIYVLIKIMKYVMADLEESEGQIKQYIRKNCGLKIYDRENTISSAFHTVQVTATQFFFAWLFVWLVWLIYYVGALLLSLYIKDTDNPLIKSYEQIFDFLNSTAMFAIYIILTNVTVNYRKRSKNRYAYLEPILVWTFMLIFCIAGFIVENYGESPQAFSVMSFYVSVISAITFILVLGKLNSTYLKIPVFFMIFLYIYAIIQIYIPFEKNISIFLPCWFADCLKLIPYITLLGKMVLMLTICWIAVQRRFIFYLIHRSTIIDRTDELLSELNKERVVF